MRIMENFHGIIVEEGLKNKNILNNIKILGKRIGKNFTLLRIEVDNNSINKIIRLFQKNLLTNPNYYSHFYYNNKLIVVFPNKIFRITTNKKTWKEAIEYGKSIGIPEEQLDFFPCRKEDEKY